MSVQSTCGVHVPLLLSLPAAINWNVEGGSIVLGSLLLLDAALGYSQSLKRGHSERHLGDIRYHSRGILNAFGDLRDTLGTLGTP